MIKVFLISAKLLLVGWSLVFFLVAGWGYLYFAATARGMLRPELLLSFGGGFGALFAVYCIVAALGVFKLKALLISGIIMHFVALYCIYWISDNYYPEDLNSNLRYFGIFTSLWMIHFLSQAIYERSEQRLASIP